MKLFCIYFMILLLVGTSTYGQPKNVRFSVQDSVGDYNEIALLSDSILFALGDSTANFTQLTSINIRNSNVLSTQTINGYFRLIKNVENGPTYLRSKNKLYYASASSIPNVIEVPDISNILKSAWVRSKSYMMDLDNQQLVSLNIVKSELNNRNQYLDSLELITISSSELNNTFVISKINLISLKELKDLFGNTFDPILNIEEITYDARNRKLYMLMQLSENPDDVKTIIAFNLNLKTESPTITEIKIPLQDGVYFFKLSASKKNILLGTSLNFYMFNVCDFKLSVLSKYAKPKEYLYFDQSKHLIKNNYNEILIEQKQNTLFSCTYPKLESITGLVMNKAKRLFISGNSHGNKGFAGGIYFLDLGTLNLKTFTPDTVSCNKLMSNIKIPTPNTDVSKKSTPIPHSKEETAITQIKQKSAYVYYTKSKSQTWTKYISFTEINFQIFSENKINLKSFDFLSDVLGRNGEMMNFDSMDNAIFQSKQKATIKFADGLEYRTREGTVSFQTRQGPKIYPCKYSIIFKNAKEYGFAFFYSASPYDFLLRFR